MVKNGEIGKHENVIAKFPGPVIFVPSRTKWWLLTMTSGLFTVSGIFLILNGEAAGIPVAALFGFCTAIGMIWLLPGASLLRLDASGFGVTRFFRAEVFHWNEVSDFGVWAFWFNAMVVFKVAKPRLSLLERSNAALADGRNGYLPDTYGLKAEDLLQIMTVWQHLATDPTK